MAKPEVVMSGYIKVSYEGKVEVDPRIWDHLPEEVDRADVKRLIEALQEAHNAFPRGTSEFIISKRVAEILGDDSPWSLTPEIEEPNEGVKH